MRLIPPAFLRTTAALLLGGTGACVSSMPASAPYYDAVVPGLKELPVAERARAIDSLSAQAIADADGPRVRVRANFANETGTRRVEAWVYADDDAYILVGHIGASGRVQVVFPSSPQDDGFVRGGHSYRVPPFFGGFTDDYVWRRSQEYVRLSNIRSRRDSYDAGTGYVFVIASWRPMHFDRVADGNKWTSYEISDEEYLTDPRTAVDELAAAVAGDERTAYTVDYAKYYSTNNGQYASNYYDRCSYAVAGGSPFGYQYGLGGYRGLVSTVGYGSAFGYGFGFPTWSGYTGSSWPYSYRQFYDAGTGCTYYEPVMTGFPVFVWNQPPKYQPPTQLPKAPRPIKPPDKPNAPPRKPVAPPLELPGDAGQRAPRAIAAEQQAADVHGHQPGGYHRPGLIVDDDPSQVQPGGAGPRMTPRTDPLAGTGRRPSIEQMTSRRQQPGEVRGRSGSEWSNGAPARPRFEQPRPVQPRFEAPRESQPRFEAPRSAPSTPRFEAPRAPAHMEPVRSAPPPPPPPSTSSSTSSGSSGGHQKP